MSKTIDEKVVEMRFDNKQFEEGVQTSLSTLEKLKKGLDLDGAAKGLDSLGNAAKKCDMSTLSRSVEAVSAKFSALETIAVGALLKIGSQAVTAGEQLLKSMTIDQVTAGWDKYAEKTTAVQTIMAATERSIDDVNGSLEKLIWFTDETSYSMTDMTSNIGKFTSQGVDLDVAVTAMEGISTWAALSGGSINEASRAMYNLSQALGVGAVKLMDWKSIENANMATKEFKEMAMEAAVATGDLTKSFDEAGNAIYQTSKGTEVTAANFSSTLQDAWFTSDALIEVLNNYGSYADGVYELYNNLGDGVEKTTSEIIQDLKSLKGAEDQTILDAGYTEDQIELVRRLSEEVGGVGQRSFSAAQEAKTFSEVIGSVKEAVSSGWAQTFETIFGNYEEAKNLWTDLANALYEVFAEGGNSRNELLSEALSISGFNRFTSVVEDAGIELNAFQEKLNELSDAKGISLSRVIAEYGSLEEAVQNGAISTDLLREAAAACAGELEDVDVSSLNQTLDEVVDGIDELSGRQHLVSAFWNTWEGAGALLSTVKEAFQEIFPPTTAEQVYNFAQGLNELTERFKTFLTESEEGQKLLADLTSTFKGAFAAIDIVRQALSALWRSLAPEGSAVGNLLSGILSLTGSFGEWLVNLDETIKKNDTFYKGLKAVVDFIKGAITTIKEFASAIGKKLNLPDFGEAKENVKAFLSELTGKISFSSGLELLGSIFENLCARANQVKDAIAGMKDSIVDSLGKIDGATAGNKFVQVLNGIWTLVTKVAGAISGLLGSAINGLIHALSNADFNGILNFLNILATGGAIAAIKKFLAPMNEMKDTFGSFLDWIKGIGGGVSKILDGVRGSLEAWQTMLKADALGKIAAAIAVLAVSLLVLSTIDSEKLSGSLAAMTTLFVELTASMAVLDKLDVDGKAADKTATAMVKMGAALFILSMAVKSLSELDPVGLTEGLIGVGVLLAEVAAFLKFADFEKGVTKAATGMVIFAAAIKILASVVQSLGGMDWGDMAQGLVGVGVLLAEVDVFLNTAKFSGKAISTATGIVILAVAIKILASACSDFGAMSWGEIAKGLTSIGALLLEITAFTKLSGDAKHVISTGLALIEIAAAMKIFASAMGSFGGMSWEGIAKGLLAMGGALAEIAVAVNFMPKNMVSIGLGFIEIGAALTIIASAFGKMGDMSWGEIARGLVALGGALAELSIALNLMNGTLKGSAALLVAAGALAVLTPALLALGAMSWESIAKGLITIAGAFTVIGIAAAVLSPLTATILALSAALALIGVGAVAIGGGLVLIGVGLTSVSAGMVAFATAVSTNAAIIVAGFSAIVLGIAGLIPAIAEKIGEAIVAICGVISQGAPAIGEAIKAIVLTLVDVVVECVPAIVGGVYQLILGVLSEIITYAPQIIDSVMQFLIEIINGIAGRLPELIQAVVNVFREFFSGLIGALGGIDADTLINGIEAIGLMTGLVAALSAVAAMIPAAMAGVLGLGGLVGELAIVFAAVGALAQIPGLEWLINEGGTLLETVGTAIGSFVGGIIGGFMGGISGSFPKIGEDLSGFMTNVQPFIDGASKINVDTLTGVQALIDTILLLTAADVFQGLTSWLTGGSSLSSFAEQLIPFGEAMMEFSQTVDGLNSSVVTEATTAGMALTALADAVPNSGGVLGFFAGNNDLDAFAEQLIPFGEAMMEFSQTVDGLNSSVVTKAATAGTALVELANTVPNCGGVIGFFAGNNNLDTFGEQLVVFGDSMKKFSDSVNGLDSSVVTTAATAGTALVELANTVPNCGGVVGFFAGENNLDTFGEQLVVFGDSMKKFSDSAKGMDSSVVTAAATAGTALVELANTVPNCGGVIGFFAGNNNLDTFGEQLVSFGDSMRKFSDIDSGKLNNAITQLQTLIDVANSLKGMDQNAFSNLGTALKSLANSGIDEFANAFSNCGDRVSSAITDMLNCVSDTISGNQDLATAGMQDVMGAVAKAITDKISQVETSTAAVMVALVNAIKSKSGAAAGAMQAVMNAAVNAIKTSYGMFYSSGQTAGQGFVAGIRSRLEEATAAGTALARAAWNAAREELDSHSPSRKFIHLGQNVGEGFAIGINNRIVQAVDAASEMTEEVLAVARTGYDKFMDWIDERKYYEELGLMDELAGWEQLQQMYKEGSEERKKIDREVYRVQNEIVAATYQSSLDWIEEEKYYNRLSLEEELAAYERMQGRYLEGSEERKKIDREIYRLRNALVDASYEHSMNWIEREKYYNRLSLEEELAAYERVQARYAEGSEEWLKMEREKYRVRNEIVDASYENSMNWIEQEKYYNRMSLADELAAYKRVQSRYAAGTAERKKMDREVYRLEKEIYEAQQQYLADIASLEEETAQKRLDLEQEYADKVKSINEKLASDIEAENNRYMNALESRANSLYGSYGLFDEVKEKEAVSSDTLMQNLEDQVKEFAEWRDTLDSLSARGVDSELISELSEMGPSSIAQIKALKSMTDTELNKYVSLWKVKHGQARAQAVSELEDLRMETLDNIAQLRADADTELEEYRETWLNSLEQINADAEVELTRLQNEFAEKVGLIKKDTETEMQEMADTAQAILRDAGWDETGQQIVTGLEQGIEEEKPSFINTLVKLASAGIQAFKELLGINSPSRVFRELGNFTGLGFVEGLVAYADRSYEAGSTVAEYAKNGLSDAMLTISDYLNSGMEDVQPTIRPVLDLSDVAYGVDAIDGLFQNHRLLALAGQTSFAFSTNSGSNDWNITVDNDGVVQELRSLRSEMAEMTARIEQMQIVLDSGTVVGQLAGPMDEALGQRASYRRRGI